MVADPRIRADTEAHFLDVRAHSLSQVREFVHEADLRREHRVRSVLGQLRGAHVHHDHSLTVARERIVEHLQQFGRPWIVGADDDAVRLHEVGDRRALLQELGVRDDVELDAGIALLERRGDTGPNLVGGTDRYGRLGHDDPVLVHVLADRAGNVQDVAQVRRTVLARRCTHRAELEQAMGNALRGARREREPARLEVLAQHHLEPRFEDRRLALAQQVDLALIDVDAKHVVAGFREAGARDQTNVPGSKDGQTHDLSL